MPMQSRGRFDAIALGHNNQPIALATMAAAARSVRAQADAWEGSSDPRAALLLASVLVRAMVVFAFAGVRALCLIKRGAKILK